MQSRPVLWDRRNKAHKNTKIINTSWDEVASSLSSDRETVRKAWKNLVDQFRTNYKNVMRNMPPDIVDHPDVVEHMFKNIRWTYFQQLLFLQDIVKTKRGINDTDLSENGDSVENISSDISLTSSFSIRSEQEQSTKIRKIDKVIPRINHLDKNDEISHFTRHCDDLLRHVPSKLRTKCQQSITNIIYSYIEEKIPEIKYPN